MSANNVGLGWAVCVATLLSACTGPAAAPLAIDAVPASEGLLLLSNALVNDHDHSDAVEHPHVEWRIRQVFETNLPMDGHPLSPASEFVLHGHYAYVSLFHPSGGIVILDLEEPDRPVQIGYFDSGTAYVNDVEVSPDGRFAFLPTSPIKTSENSPVDGGTPVAGDYGVQVVDVSNPRAPRLAALWAGPDRMGYHRLDLEQIGDQLYVFGASLGFPRIDILRFVERPTPHLVPVSIYISEDARNPAKNGTSAPDAYGIHDVTVDPDPLLGSPLMAVSHWRSGAHFVDVGDPANPRFLGKWDAFTGIEMGNVHNVMFTKLEDRRVAVITPEYPRDPKGYGTHWIVDVTDFQRPVLLGNWSIPGQHGGPGNAPFSTNRVEIRNGTLFIAHFHAGVLVVDVSTLEKARRPELLGFVLPKGETIVPYLGVRATPYIYDAIPRGNYLYYTDLTGGFHVARMPPEVVRGNVWSVPGESSGLN